MYVCWACACWIMRKMTNWIRLVTKNKRQNIFIYSWCAWIIMKQFSFINEKNHLVFPITIYLHMYYVLSAYIFLIYGSSIECSIGNLSLNGFVKIFWIFYSLIWPPDLHIVVTYMTTLLVVCMNMPTCVGKSTY